MRQTLVNNADLFLFYTMFSSNTQRQIHRTGGKKEEMRVKRVCGGKKGRFAMAFINIVGPLERWRTTVMITLGNEKHFSAGQTVADNMCMSLETVVLGMCWNLYENLNSPVRQRRYIQTNRPPQHDSEKAVVSSMPRPPSLNDQILLSHKNSNITVTGNRK